MPGFGGFGGSPLEAFGVGQGLAQGQSTLGNAVKSFMERYNAYKQTQSEAQLGFEKEKALIPLKEQSAMRLLQEKAKINPMQQRPLSGETAGRLSLASQGSKHASMAKQLLFPKGSPESFNRGLIVAMQSPWGVGMIGNQDSQSLEFNLSRAIEAQLRSETGATAPPDELKRLTKQFITNAVADPNVAYERLSALEGGLSQTAGAIDPTGYYRKVGASPFESQDEDLSSLPDEDILSGA